MILNLKYERLIHAGRHRSSNIFYANLCKTYGSTLQRRNLVYIKCRCNLYFIDRRLGITGHYSRCLTAAECITHRVSRKVNGDHISSGRTLYTNPYSIK